MSKKKKSVGKSLYLTYYRWSIAFDRYSLAISVNVTHLSAKRKTQICKQSDKIDDFLVSLTIDDCFDIINLYQKFTRMIFTKSELEKCKKVEIYLLYFSKDQATTDPSLICRTESKSRIVTRYGRLVELCLYECENDELYHIWSNKNWLWKDCIYQIKSYQNCKKEIICAERHKIDNPIVLENYVQPTINKMLNLIDKFI